MQLNLAKPVGTSFEGSGALICSGPSTVLVSAGAAGLVVDQATGLMVPRRKIWQVSAKAPVNQGLYTMTHGEVTVDLPEDPDLAGRLIQILDSTGQSFEYRRAELLPGEHELHAFPHALHLATLVIRFNSLSWVATPNAV